MPDSKDSGKIDMRKIELSSKRLLLREFKMSDWHGVQEYAKDPEVVRFMEWGPNTNEQTQEFVERALEFQLEKPRRFFELAVIHQAEQKLIGAIGIRILSIDNSQAEIGYCFNRNYWRQGFAAEACQAPVDFGFLHLNLHRIYATCDAENLGSAAVLKKCAMRQEGNFHQDKKVKGRFRDTFFFAILQDEWERARS